VIEIHTGAWCHALFDGDKAAADDEWRRIAKGAKLAKSLGLEVHAGTGSITPAPKRSRRLPEIAELNIGHFLIGEAVFTGLAASVKVMRAAMDRGRAKCAELRMSAHDFRSWAPTSPMPAASPR
jgi:pyridoxine 5-phosphate synthase